MKKGVSLKDIAQKVGVSTALVSYVMNGKEKESRVSKTMAAKIKKVAKELDYQPNLIARSLKFGKTKTIGLIVADISNPFFSSLARIIENEAKKEGYTVLFGSNDEQADKSSDLINALLNRQVDGLIIAPVENSENQINDLTKKGVPVVLIDRYFPNSELNSVFINNFDSAYKAVQHLLDHGYKKIGMLAYHTSLDHMKERVRGYEKCLQDNGVAKKENWLLKTKFATDDNAFKAKLNALIQGKQIDSLLFATVSLALKSLHVIDTEELKIPRHFGLVSFDESDAFDFFYAPLTYVRQDLKRLGEESVKLLIKRINDENTKIEKIEIPTELIIRKSSLKRASSK